MNALTLRVVLRVDAGASALAQREFVWGAPVAALSVGSQGDWQIQAPGVASVHLFLAFDGHRLHVAAAAPGHSVSVGGAAIGTSWTPIPVPARLVFGAAAIAIDCADLSLAAPTRIQPRPIVDLSRSGRAPTQVVDLSQTLRLRTVRLELPESLLAELRNAPAPTTTEPAPAEPAAGGVTLIHEPVPVKTLRLPMPAALVLKQPATELVNTLYDGGALRERGLQLACVSAADDAAPSAHSVPARGPAAGVLNRGLASFRHTSLPKRLTITLLPFALVGVWAMRGGSAQSATHLPPRGHAGANYVEGASASIEGPLEPQPSANSGGAPLLPRSAPAVDTVGLPSGVSERLALIAAFSGNETEAAVLYDRLAVTRNSGTFALAARLIREDRVRKP